jgi:hypothetical protein
MEVQDALIRQPSFAVLSPLSQRAAIEALYVKRCELGAVCRSLARALCVSRSRSGKLSFGCPKGAAQTNCTTEKNRRSECPFLGVVRAVYMSLGGVFFQGLPDWLSLNPRSYSRVIYIGSNI